jgi:hypothetical protein
MAAKPAKQEGKNSMKMQARKLNGLGQENWINGDAGGQGGGRDQRGLVTAGEREGMQ